MLKHCWAPQSSDRKFPTKHRCHTCQLPPLSVTFTGKGSVCLCVGESVWEVILKHLRGWGPCSRPGSSSSLAGRCQEAASSTSCTYRWPGSPFPGWLQGRGSNASPRRASWGDQWRPSGPNQSPESSVCSRTLPRCCWVSGPVQTQHHRKSYNLT